MTINIEVVTADFRMLERFFPARVFGWMDAREDGGLPGRRAKIYLWFPVPGGGEGP